MKNSIDYVE